MITKAICINDYEDVYFDDNYYFYPLLADKETILRRGILPDGREGVVEDSVAGNKENCNQNSFKSPPANKKSTRGCKTAPRSNKKKLSDEEVEILILEVQKRIPLWNFNIPLMERTRDRKLKLWEEVAAVFNGKLTVNEVKIKFKNIRDTYRKLINAEYRPSGSAAVPLEEQWKFYHCCEFLRDFCLSKETSSNVTVENINEEFSAEHELSVDDTISEACDEELRRNQTHGIAGGRKRTRSNNDMMDSASALSRIADALSRESLPVTLPEPPQLDTVGAFLLGLGNQIRLLPQSDQSDIIKQLTDIVYEAVKRNR